jgi:DNA-binding transcriptional regulator of glucitol operon
MRRRWLSGRALTLHVLVIILFPLCLLAGWWQANRAMSGNTLSYLYAIEWPIFAILGVYGWWQLIHDVPVGAVDQSKPKREPRVHFNTEVASPAQPLEWDEALESPELRAYNEYLESLRTGGGRKSWRNPRGLPS